MAKEGFILYKSMYEPIRSLTTECKGMLLDAIYLYHIDGTLPDASSPVYMAFMFFKNQFDIDEKKYKAKCQKNSDVAKKRWHANASERMQTVTNDADIRYKIEDNDIRYKIEEKGNDITPAADVSKIFEPDNLQPEPNAPEKPDTQKKFRPPEIEEVENFMFKINFPGIIKNEAEKFMNHYTSNGWKVGKTKMQDWQATVRNWKLRRNEETGTTNTGTGATGNTTKPSKHGFSDEELFAAVARQHGIPFMPPNGNGGDQ